TMVCGGLVIQRDVALDGGTLDLGGGALEVDPYTGNGLTLSGTLMNVGQIRAYGITPEYPLALYKMGTGTLTLLGTNTYTEGSTVVAGTLRIGNGSVNGTLPGDVTNYGTLSFANPSAQTYSGVISGSGTLKKYNAGTLTLTGNNIYSGSTTVNAGTLRVGDGGTTGAVGSGSIVIVEYVTLEFDRGNNLTVANTISGSGGLVKSGDGTLTLTGNNTYTGGTVVSGGAIHTTMAAGQGKNMQYALPVQAGQLQEVWATWDHNQSGSQYAVYQIFDGDVHLDTVLIDQTQAPTGESHQDKVWQNLGHWSTTSGSLTVKILNNPNQTVQVNAVRASAAGAGTSSKSYVISLSASIHGEAATTMYDDHLLVGETGWIAATSWIDAVQQAIDEESYVVIYGSTNYDPTHFKTFYWDSAHTPYPCGVYPFKVDYAAALANIPSSTILSTQGILPTDKVIALEEFYDDDWDDYFWKVSAFSGDLSLDSDNNDRAGTPAHTALEDSIENQGFGKIIAVQAKDADGDALAYTRLVPMNVYVTDAVAGTTKVQFYTTNSSIVIYTDAARSAVRSLNQSYNVNEFTWDAFGKTTVYLEATAVDVINLTFKVDQFNTSNWVTVDTVKITTVEQDLTPTECRPDTHVTEQNTVVLENYISVDINGQRGGYNALHYDSADPALFNQNVVESQVFFTGNAVAVRQNNRWALWDYVNGALQPRVDAKLQGYLVDDDSTIHRYEPDGTKWTFSEPILNFGRLNTMQTPGSEAAVYSFDEFGRLEDSTKTVGPDNAVLITEYEYSEVVTTQVVYVSISVQASPAETARTVEYQYYAAEENNGNEGDVKSIVVRDADENIVDQYYYRYYKPGQGDGFERAVKFVFDTASIARAQAASL
ncbi:MAG: hypothetical protein GX594_12370, partial [Pirellulaceae bacterium]|nr:hypothetical protein [Pirellulaceae bacterium]